jgi:Mg-chelatase subunit ChlD
VVGNLLKRTPGERMKGKFIKTDLALHIASKLGANYYTIEDLKADYLTEIVQQKKSETATF